MQLRCLDLGLVEYRRALALQEACVAQRRGGVGQDRLLLLEHPPVFTLGRGADEGFVLNAGRVPVHRVSRGGQVTFHGPGQLIGYPILVLPRHRRDVHVYIRGLENVLIETLASYGLEARQREGLTGVWCGTDKIASIGIGIRRWVTFHGFALNVDPDLSYFDAVIPCGLAGVRMTSMARTLGHPVVLQAVKLRLAEIFAATFGYQGGALLEETLWNTHGLTGPTSPGPENAAPTGSKSACPVDRATPGPKGLSQTSSSTPYARKPTARTSASAGATARPPSC